jgi:stearoyl-CoA desaturase (delta-9 desaturase)
MTMSNDYLVCAAVLVATYAVNTTYITVFYHRGLAHGGVELKPGLRRFVAATGSWVTGLDPKAWACMHRQHHQHADTARDPHSPRNVGILGVLVAQFIAYKANLALLIMGHPKYTKIVEDLEFPVSWINRRSWAIPYALHLAIAIAIGEAAGAWLLGAAYFIGLMSHPIQGWMVNALGHAYGYRNFDTPDGSRNNTLVALLVVGEGYQNNHHRNPRSPTMAVKWYELDLGYVLCRLLGLCGLVTISPSTHQPIGSAP